MFGYWQQSGSREEGDVLTYLDSNLRLPFSTTLALFDPIPVRDFQVYLEHVLE